MRLSVFNELIDNKSTLTKKLPNAQRNKYENLDEFLI